MYRTEDLYLAGALQQAGLRLRAVWKDGRRSTFEFDESDKLQQVVGDYFSGSLNVDAFAYSERIRSAKSMALNAPERNLK